MNLNRMISETEAYRIINEENQAYISMIDLDHKPYGVSVNYAFDKDENKLYFHCSKTGRKIQALKANPNVSVLIVQNPHIVEVRYTTHYFSAMIEGKISFIDEAETKKEKLNFICNHLCPNELERRDFVIEKYLKAVLIGCIEINKISGKSNQDE
ncbi:MAG: pyridoxamine 5'-phosphate oxidase family protein [Erysipelotrichaceae bacterium]